MFLLFYHYIMEIQNAFLCTLQFCKIFDKTIKFSNNFILMFNISLKNIQRQIFVLEF